MSTATSTASLRERTRITGCGNCAQREAHLATQALRFRDRTRLRGIMARASFNSIDINPTAVPQIGVGDTRTVRVALSSNVISDFFDPDHCISTAVAAGLEVEARAFLNGSFERSDEFCIPASGFTRGNTREFQVPIVGSSPGQLDLRIEVRGSTSGTLLAERTIPVQIVEAGGNGGGTVPDCVTDEDCPEGKVCRDGECVERAPLSELPCFVDPDRACTGGETIAWGGAALLVASVLVGR